MLNGMNNKNESNGPGRDATSVLASSTPTRHTYKSMIRTSLITCMQKKARWLEAICGLTVAQTQTQGQVIPFLHSTRLSKQDDTRALSHNPQLSIWRQGRLAGDLRLTKQTERSLVSYLRRFTPTQPGEKIFAIKP